MDWHIVVIVSLLICWYRSERMYRKQIKELRVLSDRLADMMWGPDENP